MKRRNALGVLAAGALLPLHAAAENGVSDTEVLLGSSGILSGPLGATIKTFLGGATAAFDVSNAAGGVNGRRLRLLSLDDELAPPKAVANYKRLLETDKVFAMFGCVGSGTTAAAAEVLQANGAVMVGGYAVADAARERAGDAAFFVRASTRREAEVLVRHLTTIGIQRVAVAYLDNPGGMEALRLVEAELAAQQLKTVASAAVKGDGSNIAAAVQALAPGQPQALLMYLSGRLPADLMTGLRQAGSFPSFYGMSIVSGEVVARLLGDQVRGLAIAQVMPFPWWKGSGDLARYQALLGATPGGINYYSVEGWIAAQVMLEALRRSGRDLTRPKLAAALRSLRLRLAGMDIDFSGGRNTGSRFVELVQVRADGTYVR